MKWLAASSLAFVFACSTAVDDAAEQSGELAASSAGTICEGLRGGAGQGATALPLVLSRAHAAYRNFGVVADTMKADRTLITALTASLTDERVVLNAYAAASNDTCAIAAAPSAIPVANVEMVGATAFVRFGSGPIAIPADAASVVIDLRAADESPALLAFLDAVSAAAVPAGIAPLRAKARVQHGLKDEFYSPWVMNGPGIYVNSLDDVDAFVVKGGATRDLGLGVLVGERVAPTAARFALALRSAGRAKLLGADIHSAVAESLWIAAANYGLAVRATSLALPDIVTADAKGDESALALAAATREALAVPAGASTRAAFVIHDQKMSFDRIEHTPASRYAALISFHGAIKSFFPYWSVVGDESDQRLLDALARIDTSGPSDSTTAFNDIGFFGHALHDSHGFVWPFGQTIDRGKSIPIVLDESKDGEPFVRLSSDARFESGDVIVEVDGRPAKDVMHEAGERIPSSESSRFRNEVASLAIAKSSPRKYQLRAPNGALREVTVDPSALDPAAPPPALTPRRHGTLEDRGHADLYYVNLNGAQLSVDDIVPALDGVFSSKGVVLDMRGYPGEATQNVTAAFRQHAGTRHYGTPVVGPFSSSKFDETFTTDPIEGAYSGKVAVLVGPSSQSAAEDTVLWLQATADVHVLGRPTAGADGNITSMFLPGGFAASFTGMEILRNDGSVFHGRGVPIDERVDLAPSDLAAGLDPELDAAVKWLTK